MNHSLVVEEEVLVEDRRRRDGVGERDPRRHRRHKSEPEPELEQREYKHKPKRRVDGLEGRTVVRREQFEVDPDQQIEERRLRVQVVEALHEPAAQELRVERLPKIGERARVETNTNRVKRRARGNERGREQRAIATRRHASARYLLLDAFATQSTR